ncbi:MAG: DEAD/DEAH box helicase, partial [Anaeroplasmataceae bacterium]
EKVKDELITFLGDTPFFKTFANDSLPTQKGTSFELKEHQEQALNNLKQMRLNGETIALLYHATGTGKTVTAVKDVMEVGGRTLFLVNALKLADQAEISFNKLWPSATTGKYTGEQKNKDAYVVFSTVQTLSQKLSEFKPEDFDYIIVDECHHSSTNTYKKVFSYFKPKFILGLTATPDRNDGEDILEMFKNVAHRMDLKTAVEKGELVPIRCIRIKTDIDLTSVRINGIKYNSQDLESRLFVPERNNLIVDTYNNYVKGKKTVVFCASVNNANDIANLFKEKGINASGISSQLKTQERNRILSDYESGKIDVLCACDILNEGWDSPKTEVLFMARPTMSKTIYLQQLGRGTRKSENKECLFVFDFVDNSNMFNTAHSLHRILNISEYTPGGYVCAPEHLKQLDKDMLYKGEKPEITLNMPIDIDDLELIDIFDWQDSVKDMISELEFVRMVDVQSETVSRYIKDKKIIPDISIPFCENRFFHYFNEPTIKKYAKEFKWDLITNSNIKDKFFDFIKTMDMSYSYKPIFLKAVFNLYDTEGKVRIADIIEFVNDYYKERKYNGLIVEKQNSLYSKDDYSIKDVERNILSNPFKRFADMRFINRCKDIEYIQLNTYIWRYLSDDDIESIINICDIKLDEYYKRIDK